MVEAFYKLEQPRYEQTANAYYDVAENSKFGDFPKCPQCGGPVGMRQWLPPRQVHLKQIRRIGDLVFGSVGDMIVSDRFKVDYENIDLNGIKEFNLVQVISMKPKNISREIPLLYEAVIAVSHARAVFDQMGVTWTHKPSKHACDLCGPGGGGKNGQYASYERIVIDPSWKIDTDIFHPINLPGVILLSHKAYEFFDKHSFGNAFVVPCSQASLSFKLDPLDFCSRRSPDKK